ncbi:MAG: 3-deoxy-D-manno-octulosonate 8-phosphate phosphatase [Candidatus Cloacimonadota bacterium]|nr:MAG: 3-deoxy-D-manno-octulosonate 8-phosphate phosphatase [Candidatus Cloacimonadota bacterium]PIE79212.1 MAG: 3-deoxy-D-manno-octulosonate 8-phosphate phosphatase [Candidatus Delongbacteria bacterium]
MGIKLIVLDVDGCLTDGKIYYHSTGDISKSFSAKDGFFIKHIMKPLGYKFAIITGGKSDIVNNRAKILDIDYVYCEAIDKQGKMEELISSLSLNKEEIAYFGDDWFDWPAMKLCGYKGTPKNGSDELKKRVDFISNLNGGEASVREFLKSILKKEKRYEEALSLYFD